MELFDIIIKGFNRIINFLVVNRKIILFFLKLLSPFIILTVMIFVMYLLYKAIIFTDDFYKKYLKNKLAAFKQSFSEKYLKNKPDIKNRNIFKISEKTMKNIEKIWDIIYFSLNNVFISIFTILSVLYIIGNDKTDIFSFLTDIFLIFGISQIIVLPYTIYKIKKSAPEHTGTDKS